MRRTNYATGQIGTPVDFVAFHAKGSPTFTNGHVRMGISTHLRAVNDGFKIVASYPELKPKPIVIGDKGERLKRIGTAARKDMERLFDGKVYLGLWVKVKRGWTEDERALRSFGYN